MDMNESETEVVPEEPTLNGYLECETLNCKYLGLVKIPNSQQHPWGQEALKFIGLEKLITAECPGCHNTKTVRTAEEIAPDINKPEELATWLQKYATPNLVISYAHKSPEEQKALIIKEANKNIEEGKLLNRPDSEIKQDLVDYVSRDYPEPTSEHTPPSSSHQSS